MAKKTRKTQSLLPKRIAGVKVPKAVRKGRFGELLASRTGQVLIAEAIMAAGAVAGAKKAGESPKARRLVHQAAERVRHAGDGGGRELGAASATLAYALGEAARSFADALRHGDDGHEPNRHDAPAGGDTEKKTQQADQAGPL